jgi:hypothetical protein
MSRNQIWLRGVLLLLAIAVVFVMAIFALPGCPATRYPGGFQTVTPQYKPKKSSAKATPGGVLLIVKKSSQSFAELGALVDKKTTELEACLLKTGALKKKIRRDWFGVYIPKDWYVSSCSKEQLVPSKVSYKLCEAKGLKIEEECRFHVYPTEICPCVCNIRAGIHWDFWIVTGPNLKLFKAELARLTTNQNNPWAVPAITQCLK